MSSAKRQSSIVFFELKNTGPTDLHQERNSLHSKTHMAMSPLLCVYITTQQIKCYRNNVAHVHILNKFVERRGRSNIKPTFHEHEHASRSVFVIEIFHKKKSSFAYYCFGCLRCRRSLRFAKEFVIFSKSVFV